MEVKLAMILNFATRQFAFTLALFAVLFVSIGSVRAFETLAKEVVLMDADTGAILFQKNGDIPMSPASMSKLMTVFIIFERLRDGRLSLDDTFRVSENAWRKGGAKSGSSTMFWSLERGLELKT